MRRGAVVLVLGAVLAACGGESASPPSDPEPMPVAQRPIEAVMNDHVQEWMQTPGVTVVYISQDEHGRPCIKIGVREFDEERDAGFGHEIEGYPIVVEETGEIRPLRD